MNAAAPQLFLVGVTHRKASIELRERLALTPAQADTLRQQLRAITALKEFCLLSTCNRIEIYGIASDAQTPRSVLDALATAASIDPAILDEVHLQRSGEDAVRHLFAVVSGLDSQIVGETEILGQVKDAYASASTEGSVGTHLNRVFQKAFQAAKTVRSSTAIGEGQVSAAAVAVSLAEKIFGDLRRSCVLVVGAGDIAEKTARAFVSRNAQSITIANRTLERASEMAVAVSGTVLPYERLAEALHDFDIVVGSTAAPTAILTRTMVESAMRSRKARPLFFIDLALPRDVEAAVGELTDVFLYNLDDLARIADDNIAQRQAEISHAETLLRARAAALWERIGPSLTAVAPIRKTTSENVVSSRQSA